MRKVAINYCKTCGASISSKATYCATCYHKSDRVGGAVNKRGKDHPHWGKRREGATNWKGGRVITKQGYTKIRSTDHPHNDHGYVLEHRLVMEEKLGRYLNKSELVHHRNGVRSDNRIENLIIVTRNKHKGQVICPHCGEEFLIE